LTDSLAVLKEINLTDLVTSFGWQDHRLLRNLTRGVFQKPAETFARQMLSFDHEVGKSGLSNAGLALLQSYARSLRVIGRENIPTGPVLFLSNHPGMVDTLALFSTLDRRRDLRVIAVHRPFLAALVNTSQSLDYLDDDPRRRITLVRKASAHLRAGGAILTFPSGQIEPDPDVYPGAVEALQGWTDSVEVFVRIAPETVVVPVLVSGVIWRKAARHPTIYLKRDQFERERLAAALQLLAHVVLKRRPLDVVVQFGEPISAAHLNKTGKGAVHQAVLEQMEGLINHRGEGAGERIF